MPWFTQLTSPSTDATAGEMTEAGAWIALLLVVVWIAVLVYIAWSVRQKRR